MAQRPNISKRQSGKPSKALMLFALIVAFSLPYLLVKNFAHHKQSDIVNKSIALPEMKRKTVTAKIEYQKSPEIQHAVKVATKPQVVAPKAVAPKKIKDNEWQTVKPRSGDSMAAIFNRLGLSAKNLHEVLQKNPHSKALIAIKPSQQLQFLISKNRLEKLIIPVNDIQSLTIYRAGTTYRSRIDSKKTTIRNHYATAIVRGSLFNTAQQTKIPYKLVSKMTEILKREIDFSHSIRSGDQFSMVYEVHYIGDKIVDIGNILAVSYTNNKKTAQAIRHVSANGTTDYYTPKGESFKKAFTRYPIKFSHISSTFALSRAHPILHYKRAHKGIDLAAPIGTPIQTIGDGVVTVIDRHHGYGNMIKIQHDKTHSTVYAHMLKFQKGLSKGSRVKRGQVIGYVGQTGLATGPHCHFELHVNNQARNPTTTYLPTSSPVPAREMASFRTKTNFLLARLKLAEKTRIASKGKKNIIIG